MTHVGIVDALPGPYRLVQFQYRILSYVLLALSGATVALLACLRASPGRAAAVLRWTLVPVVIVSAAGAVTQVAGYPQSTIPDRNIVFASSSEAPPTLYNQKDYDDASLPTVPTPAARSSSRHRRSSTTGSCCTTRPV